MKTSALIASMLLTAAIAHADFSYTTTRKVTGGAIASMAGAAEGVSKIFFKGQKMKIDDEKRSVLIDFDAQTLTTINHAQKTVEVRAFSDAVPAGEKAPNFTIDMKETGQHKTVNGFDAKELLLTMETEMAQGRGAGGKVQIEVEMWISSNVPGASELHAFYQRNAGKFPWGAMAGGSNPSLGTALGEVQKKVAAMDGVQVEQVIRVKPVAGAAGQTAAAPQLTPEQLAKLEQARAQLEAMKAQGGMQAAIAEKALARMGAAGGRGPASASSAGSLVEITADSSDFSTSPVPDSVFTIPADYKQTTAK